MTEMEWIPASTDDSHSVIRSTDSEINPAYLYLAQMGSDESIRVVGSRLNRAARIFYDAELTSSQYWYSVPWELMDRSWLLLVTRRMKDQGAGKSAINGVLTALRGVAREAWDHQMMSLENYMRIKGTKNVKGETNKEKRLVTPEEVASLFKATGTLTAIGLRNRAMLGLLYGGGLRRSELVGIDVEHYNPDRQSITIHHAKGNKVRVAYPPAWATQALEDWLNHGRNWTAGPVFCRILKGDNILVDRRLTAHGVQKTLESKVMEANLERFTPHDLRGSMISYLLDIGEDIKTVANIVGHRSVNTTASYDRRGERARQKTNRKVDIPL